MMADRKLMEATRSRQSRYRATLQLVESLNITKAQKNILLSLNERGRVAYNGRAKKSLKRLIDLGLIKVVDWLILPDKISIEVELTGRKYSESE